MRYTIFLFADALGQCANRVHHDLVHITILRLLHLLETNHLSVQIFATVNATQTAKGLLLREGTVVDATLIAAPSSTKNNTCTRKPEMHQTKKSNQWHHGMKAQVGAEPTRAWFTAW